MDDDEARRALSHIASDLPRDEWIKIGMAIKSEFGHEGFALFEEWSQNGSSYNRQACRDSWKSIKPGGGITIATLIAHAKAGGYVPARRSGSPPDPKAMEANKREQQARNQAAEAERQRDHKEVQDAAKKEWASSPAALPTHAYLRSKRIQPDPLRTDARGNLLVPLVDVETDELWSLQRISPKGEKYNRGRKKGCGCFFGDFTQPRLILVAEGVATCASIHQASDLPALAAMDAGNLLNVVKGLRKRFSSVPLLICADDDGRKHQDNKNPGAEAARKAANSISNASVLLPRFPEGADSRLTDFNDLHCLAGLDEVKRQIQSAANRALASDILPPGFRLDDAGLWHLADNESGQNGGPIWVCSALRITALTRDQDGDAWGRLLEFDDPDGKARSWAMPVSLLAGDGAEVRRVLLDMGLRMGSGQKCRNLLNQYLQTATPKARALAADKTGWVFSAFVLPDAVINPPEGERLLFQTKGTRIAGYGCAGTLDDWRIQVAAPAAGNSRLLLALGTAFAAPLLKPLDAEPGGFHLRGASSLGKSTAMLVAASVWGSHDRLKRWRSTDNALEATALEHNDALLLLDELREADPKTLGASIYMLAHGNGKVRLSRDATARPSLNWRVMLLSTGEIGLADHVESAGGRFHAGQEARITDIPADAGQGFGLFDSLHDFPDGGTLARHLAKATKDHHGHAIHAFIERLAKGRESIKARWEKAREPLVNALIQKPEAAGMVYRVANRFALCAFAAELASEWGITGWPLGEATTGIASSFNAWLSARGGYGASEDMEALRAVRDFLQAHADARLVPLDIADEKQLRTIHRAGAIDFNNGQALYYLFTGPFRNEVCKGLDHLAVARILKERGHLVTNERDRLTIKTPQLPDGSRPRAYCIKASILEDDILA